MQEPPASPARRSTWFWVNLVALLVLIPCATVLFQRHFKTYFTEIVLFGGVFTAWMLVRLLWSIAEKALKVNTDDFSQRMLSSAGTTRMLLVAGIAVLFLWNTTASLYLDAAGADETYTVQVFDPKTRNLYMSPTEMNAGAPVAGTPWFMQFRTVPLRCRIMKPVGYETTDCSLVPGESRRVSVPHGFSPLEAHLVRLIPSAPMFRMLAPADDPEAPGLYANVTVSRPNVRQPIASAMRVPLRRETLYLVPKDPAEKAIVRQLEQNPDLRRVIESKLIQGGTDPVAARQTVEVLSDHAQECPLALLRKGDVITIEIIRASETEGADVRRGTVTHKVTADKLQTVWLSITS
jgi:hypothetical protein